jgi:hypothetical protein
VYRTVWLAALLCLGLCSPAGAQNPPAPAAEVKGWERLIEQLGDVDYRKREEAYLKLKAEGTKVLPALREAINHPDPEVRRRVGDLVPVLETAALLTPRRVTLKVKSKPIREIFDSIEKQTGYKIESWGAGNRNTYTLDINDLPFWQALDEVCRATGMVLQQGYGDDHIRLHPQEGHVPFVRYDGPFRLVPTGFQHYRNLDFGLIGKGGAAASRNESLTLVFSVFAEPRLPLLGMGEVRLDAAYDTEKNSMLVPTGGGEEGFDPRMGGMWRGRWISRYGMGNRMMSMQTQVNLARPSEKATGVKVIRGRVPVTLLAEQKPMVIADNILKAKGTRKKIDATSFHIEDVAQMPGKQVSLKMTVSEATENPNDYTWMNALYQRIELQDDKGTKFMIVQNGWGNNTPGSVELQAVFAPPGGKAGPPTKLIYYRWTTIQHEIAFEFKDLPLP